MIELKVIDTEFAVCKIKNIQDINFSDEYLFVGKTDDELSLVCKSQSVPPGYIECEEGWRCFKIKGILDFSLVGILAKISSILAENNISIFAISTFNTDYILVKKENFELAINTLKEQNYIIS